MLRSKRKAEDDADYTAQETAIHFEKQKILQKQMQVMWQSADLQRLEHEQQIQPILDDMHEFLCEERAINHNQMIMNSNELLAGILSCQSSRAFTCVVLNFRNSCAEFEKKTLPSGWPKAVELSAKECAIFFKETKWISNKNLTSS